MSIIKGTIKNFSNILYPTTSFDNLEFLTEDFKEQLEETLNSSMYESIQISPIQIKIGEFIKDSSTDIYHLSIFNIPLTKSNVGEWVDIFDMSPLDLSILTMIDISGIMYKNEIHIPLNKQGVKFAYNDNSKQIKSYTDDAAYIGDKVDLYLQFIIQEKVIAPSGRKLYRHSSNMGTVMEYIDYDDTTKKLLILDAVYRSSAKWGSQSTDTELTNITGNTGYPSFGSQTTTTNAASITDETINSFFDDTRRDPSTAKANTDVLVNLGSNYAAATYCRTVKINNTGCDLPTIQQLYRIYCDADAIDKLDPTVTTNNNKKLSGWKINDISPHWSSTESSNMRAWYVIDSGNVGYGTKNSIYAVVPVLELD